MTDMASAGTTRLAPMRRRLAAAALLWEQVWPSLWPALAVLGLFLVLGLGDLLPALPGWAHAVVLLALLVSFVFLLWRAVRTWRRPGATLAERRLERESGLDHRPLGTLGDRLASGSDAGASLLWAAHQARARRAIRALRVGLPRAGLAARDPWGVRAIVILLLAVALADARGDWLLRLSRAVQPSLSVAGAALPPPSLDAWVTPPDYTGLPPILLSRPATAGVAAGAPDPAGAAHAVAIPTGSRLLAQVHGGAVAPILKLDGKDSPFEAIDDSNYKAEAVLTEGRLLTVEQKGGVLGTWPIAIVPDKPPTAGFTEQPVATQRLATKLAYQAADDYGLASLKATITLQGRPDAEPLELPLTLPRPNAREVRNARTIDLTAHVWAGLPVAIRLSATDGIGQTGQSQTVTFTLPEREFKNPIARAIIDQRKLLSQSPKDRDIVSETLSDLSARPALFHDDFTVFLALRTASRRLMLDQTAKSIAPVQQLLWDTALRLEDGQRSSAEKDLRQAQQALQDALARNAPDAEIDRLMNQLQQAMNNYLQALAQDAQRQPQAQQQPIDPNRTISSRDLQRMLDQARRLAQQGKREAAQDMLAQLQNMLENLRAAQSGQPGQGSPGQQGMRQLQDMMRQQQSLLDRSFRQRQNGQGQQGRGQQGQNGQGQVQQGQNGMAGLGRQQDALRRMLDAMRQGQNGLGQNGQGQPGDGGDAMDGALGRAEQAMRDAVDALGRGDGDAAIASQSEALDQLGQAARSLAQQQGRQGPQIGGVPGGPGPRPVDRADQGTRDPLGRQLPGTANYDNGSVQIPEASDLQKSREILDELRRRSGDLTRPAIEHDYIERLLKRF